MTLIRNGVVVDMPNDGVETRYCVTRADSRFWLITWTAEAVPAREGVDAVACVAVSANVSAHRTAAARRRFIR